jgi:uncharacterized protein (TIGR02145 family)
MRKKFNYLIIAVYIITGICSLAVGQKKGSFTDTRDGKVYNTVTIDDQEWMGENLAFKTESGCYVYDGINDYVKTHGYLYSWEAATKACPDGWHLPSMQDWWFLSNYLGGDEVAGGKLKETGTTSWKSPNTGASNSSGFTALSSGRSDDKAMEYIGTTTFFWTNVDDDDLTSWCAALYSTKEEIAIYPTDKSDGYSVRCLKNSEQTKEGFDFW